MSLEQQQTQTQEPIPEQPKVEVTGHNTSTGHNFLKVLGISNTKNLNNWQIPYNDYDEIPKKLLDSFIGKPYVDSHAHVILHEYHEQLKAEGKSNEEINKLMHEKSMDLKIGTIVDRFDPKPDDRVNVFYMVEIEDPKENEYINKNKRPTKEYSSPGVNGTLDRYENGDGVYHLDDVLGFHITAAENPAYGKFLAKVRGVCHKGMASECKRELGFASIIAPNPYATENINTNVIINSSMSEQQSKTEVPESKINELDVSNAGSGAGKPLGDLDKQTKNLEDTFNVGLKEQAKQYEVMRVEFEKTQTKVKELEESNARKDKLLFNTLIENHITSDLFDNNEEIIKKERETAMNFIAKYKLDFDDAKDYLKRAYKKSNPVAPVKEAEKKNSKDMKKETEKSDQYGETFNKDQYVKSGNSESSSDSGTDNGIEIDYAAEFAEFS
jgi:hypothetical protein